MRGQSPSRVSCGRVACNKRRATVNTVHPPMMQRKQYSAGWTANPEGLVQQVSRDNQHAAAKSIGSSEGPPNRACPGEIEPGTQQGVEPLNQEHRGREPGSNIPLVP